MHDLQIDISCLNKTRLSKDMREDEVSVDGYDIYRYDRDTAGAGVAIYVRRTLSHYNRNEITIPSLEIIGIEITS